MHEIAHSFEIGEADDSCQRAGYEAGGEIYSGDNLDRTPEIINGIAEWSIMSERSGIVQGQGTYFVFSIEELLTILDANTGRLPCQ